MALRAPVTWRDSAEHRRKLADGVNMLLDGHTNAAGSVSLDTNPATTTTVTDARAGRDSVIVFMAKDAAAASELAAGSMYVSSRDAGSFIITHAASASARTFDYALCGTGREVS